MIIDIPDDHQDVDNDSVPWEWFGVGLFDPSWDELFDDIEELRNATKEASLPS